MEGQLHGHLVGLPQVELSTADATATFANVLHRILLVGHPLWLDVGLALDPLQISWALGIAVSGSVLGAGVVVSYTLVSLRIHLHQVDCTVETALSLGHVPM